MTDPVNDPTHYNVNGIEVIDVIETYAKTDFRLANVIKYVCRCDYKGNKLEDLRKAQWYLNRAVDELELDEAEECLPVDEWRTKSSGYSPRDVDMFFHGYDCKEDELVEEALSDEGWLDTTPAQWHEEFMSRWRQPFPDHDDIGTADTLPPPPVADWSVCDEIDKHIEFGPFAPEPVFDTWAHLPPDRIAGDDDAAQRIKGEYYDFDRFEIVGYCANCDKELVATDLTFSSEAFEDSIKFCSTRCISKLLEWQGR
jgi:hypothetical protein